MKKPSPAAIQAVPPLSAGRPPDPLTVCNVCRKTAFELRVWREHDERDLPIDGDAALVFIGHDDAHKACLKKMDQHPRLYVEVMGSPGYFPAVCGPCKSRDGFRCTHPKLMKNGGPGLLVQLRPLVPFNAIVCPPPRGPKARAESCEGRT